MELTIIETGRPPEVIAANFPTYPYMVKAMLGPFISDLKIKIVPVIDGAALPSHFDIQAALITGSPVGVYDRVDWIDPLKSWIQTAASLAIPQVGICFGHQIMAEAFGGHVNKAPQGWGLGRHIYEVSSTEAWMPDDTACGDSASLNLAVSHQDQILKVPNTARILAKSAFTPFAALVYDHAPALSFQGHPEFCQGFAQALILSRRGTRFPEAFADNAVQSLQHPLDGDRVGRWIAAFYQHHQYIRNQALPDHAA
jgi:GMP synthase-like glutamine amidotransferase